MSQKKARIGIIGYGYIPNQFLVDKKIFSCKHWTYLYFISTCGRLDYIYLFISGGIGDDNIKHEAVQLGFRQRIGSFLLNRILGSQNKKWFFQCIAYSSSRHIMLLHSL